MLPLVLAATVLAAPATVEEGCDQQKLATLVNAAKGDRIAAEMELDRRIAATLAEERKANAAAAEADDKAHAAEAGAQKLEYAAWGLGVLGLLMLILGAQRRSAVLMGSAFVLAVGMSLMGASTRSAPREAMAAAREARVRELAMVQCRFRVTDARMQMMQARIARTTHDLDEADEDIWGWVTRFENDKTPPTVEQLKHLHGEIRDSLKN